MTVCLLAVHYPRAAYYTEFVARVQHATEVMRPLPGCLAADCWVTPTGEGVVSITRWESEHAQAASFAVAKEAGVDFHYDEREWRTREILQLLPPPEAP